MRKLATAAAVSLALASGGAFGLGLGDIEMRSALNQPMNAEIRLTAVQPGELTGMIVQLASEEAFARAGLERSTALTDLTFSVDNSGPAPVIRIASARPVVEPFLNFLLEVDWPQGRMVREYTVLLDPPVFMTPSATDRNATADQPALVQRGDEALVVPTPIERTVDPSAGLEVDLLALDPQASPSLDTGELVSLVPADSNSLPGVGSSGGGEVISLGDSEIVSLSDLGAPNTAAIAQRERQALDEFEVELIDSGTEIGDDIVVDPRTNEFALRGQLVDSPTDGSSIVSLDDLTPSAQSSASSASSNSGAGEVTVNRGDTLFEIAQRNTTSGVSVQQMMMALLAANESSFINNNINLVRAGSTLRIPDGAEASQLTQSQALAAIGQQDQLWREYRDQLRGNAATQVAQAPAPNTDSSLSSAADTQPTDAPIETASLDESATDGLSAQARAILDNARNEILNREELKIVADNAPSSTTASATADESSENDAQQLGELNRKLQLAREELSSTRLQSEDLTDQAGELRSTSDNLEALVALRQNEVAQLESQLANARLASEAEAEALVELEPLDSAADLASNAAGSVAAGAESAANAAAGAVGGATDAAGNLVADATTAVSDVAGGVGESAENIVGSGTNALTEAGETLAEVELYEESADENAEASVDEPAPQQTTWYEDFLSDPKKLMIAGIGGIGLLGVLGTLLFRRKRRDDHDDSMLDFEDDVEFIDENEADDLHAEMNAQAPQSDSGGVGFGAAGAAAGMAAAGAAVAGGAMGSGTHADDDYDESASLSGTFNEMDQSGYSVEQDQGSQTQAYADDTDEDGLDKDDTISEVDVYLAYGLHGQAEELLTKAIERKPNQPEYAQKLLQTYHAQGNGEGFHRSAGEFHARFGGESNPDWQGIAEMGAELRPNEPMYAMGAGAVAAIGTGDLNGSKFDNDDFLPAQDADSGSINRGFGESDAVDFEGEDDETDLLDQSLDPAFAFDEADLEATGDFSEIANEIAAETDNGSIEFPNFDEPNGVDMDATLSEVLNNGDSSLGDALTMDELDGLGSAGDDLTLDLDQLSGDLELDTAELLDSDLSDLDIPEFTPKSGLLGAAGAGVAGGLGLGGSSGATADDAGSADEMDTMLDLAKAYIDMGDKDSASSALDEIVKSGSPAQVDEAETLLRNIS